MQIWFSSMGTRHGAKTPESAFLTTLPTDLHQP